MKAKLPIIFILLLAGLSQSGFSQKVKPKNRFAVFKVAPLVLVEPEGGFQWGLELPLLPNLSVQGEYAHLPFSYDNDIKYFQIRRGFSASAYKAEIRYYFTDRNIKSRGHIKYSGDDIQGFYFAPQAQVKNVRSVKQGFMGDEFGNSVSRSYKQQTSILKINAKIGYQILLDGFAIDTYVGAGYRRATIETEPEIFETNTRHPETWIPINIAMGLKFGWAF